MNLDYWEYIQVYYMIEESHVILFGRDIDGTRHFFIKYKDQNKMKCLQVALKMAKHYGIEGKIIQVWEKT